MEMLCRILRVMVKNDSTRVSGGLIERGDSERRQLEEAERFANETGMTGPAAAGIFTGSFVVEKIFNIPGLGTHFVNSVLNGDQTLALGVVLLYSTLLVVFNLLVDIGYAVVDPRIRVGEG